MAERGSTKHGANLDDQMKHETEGMTRGNQPAHVEEARETEPFPDSTDSPEIQTAAGMRPIADEEAAEEDET